MKLNIKNLFKYMPTVVFCLFIFIMSIMFLLLPKNEYSSQEKRKLSSIPEITFEKFFSGDFGREFETYLSDHMPFRSFFVGTNAYYDLYSGRNGSNGIYSGGENYLFTKPVQYDENMDRNISYIDEFADRTGLPVYMCIVPTSGFIMQNELPANHYEYKDDEIMDIIKSDLKKYGDNIKFIDLISSFSDQASSAQLFYKTDHHWTSEGAYNGYSAIAKSMGFVPTNKEQFKIENYNGFYGTSYAKSALWFSEPDTIEIWENKNHTDNTITVTIKDGKDEITSNTMFFKENLKTEDQYTTFLNGNHGYVKITNNENKNGKKLLIIRDSYAHCLAPFLADNYEEIVLIDLRYYKISVSAAAKSEEVNEVLVLYGLDSIVNDTDIRYLM